MVKSMFATACHRLPTTPFLLERESTSWLRGGAVFSRNPLAPAFNYVIGETPQPSVPVASRLLALEFGDDEQPRSRDHRPQAVASGSGAHRRHLAAPRSGARPPALPLRLQLRPLPTAHAPTALAPPHTLPSAESSRARSSTAASTSSPASPPASPSPSTPAPTTSASSWTVPSSRRSGSADRRARRRPRSPELSRSATPASGSNRRTLPADGTIAIRNTGGQPHRLNLVPVKPGTSRAQVGAYLRKTGARDNAPPPPFALNGPQLATAEISAGQQMQLSYKLPAGEYALVDFGQDPKTGRPEALDGVYAVGTLD